MLYSCSRESRAYLQVKGSTVGQTHPVEEIYPAHRNIAADAGRKGKPSVDNCALLLTSDDWLRSLADMRDRPGTADYQIDFAASVLIIAEASCLPVRRSLRRPRADIGNKNTESRSFTFI